MCQGVGEQDQKLIPNHTKISKRPWVLFQGYVLFTPESALNVDRADARNSETDSGRKDKKKDLLPWLPPLFILPENLHQF